MANTGRGETRARRHPLLTIALAVLLALTAAGFDVSGVRAAQLTVTNANNSGAGSLRQAIIDAQAGDEIIFSSFFNTPRTITLAEVSGSAKMQFNKSLTITGPGPSNLTIDGADLDQIFDIRGNANTVEISGMTLTNGNATAFLVSGGAIGNLAQLTLDDMVITGNNSNTAGGGVYNFLGSLTIKNSTISNNTSAAGSGGVGSNGNLTIISSTISGNTVSDGDGGGIDSSAGALTITDSTISGNTANGSSTNGGGISHSGALTIERSTISGNTTNGTTFAFGNGGGIAHTSGVLTIKSSTVSGNSASTGSSATGTGGGIQTVSTSSGSAIVNTTIQGNTAKAGGGINVTNGQVTIHNNTIAGNSTGVRLNRLSGSPVLNIGNTILQNTGANVTLSGSGTITSNGGNVSSDASGLASSLNSTNPLLDSAGLQDNGGPTKTIALQSTSPAIGYGDATICANANVSSVDQRGLTRPQGTGCDSGAVESRATAIVADDVRAPAGGTMTLSATLTDVSGATPVALNGKTVVFKLNGTQVCDNAGGGYPAACPTTNASGEAELTGVAVPLTPLGDNVDAIEALFLGATDYLPSSDKSTLTILTPQFIYFTVTGPYTYGDTPTITATSRISASPSSSPVPLAITFTSETPLTCTVGTASYVPYVTSVQLTAVGAGTCTIKATQEGDATYAPATPVEQTFTIDKKSLTVTAINANRPFGSSAVPCTVAFDGFEFSDTAAVISGSPGCTTTATSSSPPGSTHPLTPNAGTLSAANYSFGTFVDGILTIDNAGTSLTQVGLNATYGSTNGTLTATLRRTADNAPLAGKTVAFTINGVAACGVSGKPACPVTNAQGVATLGGQTVPIRNAGTHNDYTIVATFAGDGTYLASTGQGRLVIGRAILTVKPKDQTVKLRGVTPTICQLELANGSQFVNGDDFGDLNLTQLRCAYGRSGTGPTNEKVGATYRITALGALSTNYDLRYQPGTLTVVP